ncbi:MAG TPA: hypothetical protein VGR07_13810 [Thermoanaerobaculia bacterium]|jgi:hypothetical protein|nr:hypothetical protein [Thermoanaerobaculia bacterium]
MRARTCIAAALACSFALAGSALAADRQAALGDSGEVYFVRTGSYGDLFPGGTDTSPENAVLALDVVRRDQPAERLLVPGTEGPDVESSPFELYETTSGALFMVWQAQVGTIHPVLNLSSYKDGAWSPAIQVTGNPFARKSSPQIAITHDTYDVQDATDGTYSTGHRTILHLIWWEEAANGGGNVLYAPILLLDGNYVGSFQTFTLNSFVSGQSPSGVTGAAAELFRAPRIQSGASARSVLVGFADQATQRLVTLEVSMLPGELVSVSDYVRAHIIESGAKYLPKNVKGLADDVHDSLLGSGARLHPGVLSYLADQVRAHIIESGAKAPGQLKPIAEDARAHIIESGATMVGSRIDNVTAKSDSSAFSPIVEEIPTPSGTAGPEHMFQVNVDSSRPIPRTGSAPNSIFVSLDGGDSIVSWDLAGEVRYRESTDQGWGPIKILTLDNRLDLDRAHAILDQRVRDR